MGRSSLRTKLLLSHLVLVALVLVVVEVQLAGAFSAELAAHPQPGLDRALEELEWRMIGTTLFAFAIATVVGVVLARISLRPLDAMTESANAIARGDFGSVGVHGSNDELGVLSRALASLSSQLSARIGDLTGERDRLSAVLAGMVEGVLVVSREGRVMIANESAEQILEPGGPLVGRTIIEAIRHPAARSAISAAITEGRATERTLENVGPEGRSLALSVQPLAPSGEGGAVAVLHDLTRLRRLETIRRDFVSNVSHELQTPVASIQSYAEALLDGALAEPENARRFAEVIHRNAARMGRLVKDLLKLSELESRAPDQRVKEPIDLAEIAGYVVATVRQREETEDAKLVVAVPEDLRAIGDPDGVEEMLLNLVDNALKYGRKGGTIRIEAARAKDLVELSVVDDGPGIESRHLSRLFERFYRVDEGRSRERGGTGLGLAIVKHLAESMGGAVEVASEVGKGSRFTVRLPVEVTP